MAEAEEEKERREFLSSLLQKKKRVRSDLSPKVRPGFLAEARLWIAEEAEFGSPELARELEEEAVVQLYLQYLLDTFQTPLVGVVVTTEGKEGKEEVEQKKVMAAPVVVSGFWTNTFQAKVAPLLMISGEKKLEVDREGIEGFVDKFNILLRKAYKRKDYRAKHEIDFLMDLLAVWVLAEPAKYGSAPGYPVFYARCKNLFVGLKYGWGAIEGEGKKEYEKFDISEEQAKVFEETGKESRKEYLAKGKKKKEFRDALANLKVSPKVGSISSSPTSGSKTRQNSPCFTCKQFGHWAPECPMKRS